MTWKFNAAALAAFDLEDRHAGQLLVAANQHDNDMTPILILAEPGGNFLGIDISGPNAFQVRSGRRGEHGNSFVIALSHGGYDVELPTQLHSAGSQVETPGALTITPEGAFLVVAWKIQSFTEAAYVSLRDFSLHRDRPGRPMTTFGTWRLNLTVEPGTPRQTVIERGDWTAA